MNKLLASLLSGFCLIFSASADVPAVALSINGNEATITVANGVAQNGDWLAICYGDRDYGNVKEDWPNSYVVTRDLAVSGGEYAVEIPGRYDYPEICIRAFVFSPDTVTALRTDNKAFINLNETPSFDRRYEIRFRYDAYGDGNVSCFGGVSRSGGTKAFQLYATVPRPWRWICYFSVDAGGYCTAFEPVGGETYDVRMDVESGTQSVYWKSANDSAYTFSGSTSLTSIPYTGNLYLFARLDGQAYFTSDTTKAFAAIYEYKVTEISTGTVLKDLVPAVDNNGVGYMLDVVNNVPYNNAGTGAFAVEYSNGQQKACSEVVFGAGVIAEARPSGMILATVAKNVSDGTHVLYLVWGATDAGDNVKAWEHSQVIAAAIPQNGAVYQYQTAGLNIGRHDLARVIVVPVAHVCLCCGSNGGYIDLNENSSPDRQYDIRFQSSNVGGSFMGGLTSNKANILQIYNTSSVSVWFGDAVERPLFSLATDGPTQQHDLRIIIDNGDQRAYYKRADAEEYTLGASATIATVPTNVKMALCARFFGTEAQPGTSFRFARFKETEISTGRVIRDLIPLRKDGVCIVYDQENGTECPIVNGANNGFLYAEDTEETCEMFTRPKCSTQAFDIPVKKGLVVVLF